MLRKDSAPIPNPLSKVAGVCTRHALKAHPTRIASNPIEDFFIYELKRCPGEEQVSNPPPF